MARTWTGKTRGRGKSQVYLLYWYKSTNTDRGGGVEVNLKFNCFTGTKIQILTEEAGSRLALLRAMKHKRKPEADVPPKKGLIPGQVLASVSVPLH